MCAVAFFKHKVLPQCDRISSVWSRRAGRIRWFRANLEQYMNMITRVADARWLRLPASERENAGLMAPSHDLRERINDIIRERLASLG